MTTLPATSNSTRLTGPLSGTGHDILRATVITGPVPAHPPTELAGAVHPVYDRTGELGDWRAGSLQPGHHFADNAWTRFREWRATFAQDRFLGELALIRAFLDWLESRSDTSALGVLRLPSGRVDFHTALKMKVQIEAADRAVSAADQDGLGLYTAAGAKSAMRVLIPASPATLLLGLNDTTLTVGADGLSLQASGSPTQLHAISGWRISDSIVVAAGQEGELDLTGQDAGTLLRVAGRQAPLVDVHLAPLRTLLAPLLVFLRDATTLAGAVGTDLHLRAC